MKGRTCCVSSLTLCLLYTLKGIGTVLQERHPQEQHPPSWGLSDRRVRTPFLFFKNNM